MRMFLPTYPQKGNKIPHKPKLKNLAPQANHLNINRLRNKTLAKKNGVEIG